MPSLLPDFNNNLQVEGMRMQSQLLQNLGAQVRQDVQTIQTNRQLSGLAQAAQNVNTNSPDAPKQLVGLISQFPMAAQTPVGAAAINQLGAAHKLWAQEQARTQNPYSIQGGYLLNRQTGANEVLPPVQKPSPDLSGNIQLEKLKQEHRIALEQERQKKIPAAAYQQDPELKSLQTVHAKTMEQFLKKDTEAKALETEWNLRSAPLLKDGKKMDQLGPTIDELGIKASKAREEAKSYKQQADEIAARLQQKSAQLSSPVAPSQTSGKTPLALAPAVGSDLAEKAKAAIQAGKDPAAVRARLRENGIDDSFLDNQ